MLATPQKLFLMNYKFIIHHTSYMSITYPYFKIKKFFFNQLLTGIQQKIHSKCKHPDTIDKKKLNFASVNCKPYFFQNYPNA